MKQGRFIQAADGSVADAETGEVIEHGYTAILMPKRRNGFGERWMAMGQDAASTMAKQRKEIGADGYAVFMHLVSILDFENLIQISQAEIGKELDMHRQHVQRAIKKLIATGALLEGPRIGVHRSYRLNPSYGWKGSARNHQSALQERMKAMGLSVVTSEQTGIIELPRGSEDVPGQLDIEDAIRAAKALPETPKQPVEQSKVSRMDALRAKFFEAASLFGKQVK